jgi:Flp pilus assembly pilin Flp
MKKTTRRSVLRGFAAGASLVLIGCGSSQDFVSTGTAGATVLPEEIVFQFAPDTWPEGTTQLEFRFLGPPQDSQGQGLVEYALVLVLVSITVIVILQLLAPQVQNVFDSITEVEITGRTDSGEPTATATVAISTLSVETGSSFAPIVTAVDTSPVTLTSVALGPDPILLDAANAEGVQTTLELLFSNQDRIEAAPSVGTYTNNNPNVFTVDDQGVVTVANPITAFEGTLAASVSLNGAVGQGSVPVRVGRLEVANDLVQLSAPGTTAPVASILFTDGNNAPEEVAGGQGLQYRIEPPLAGVSVGSDGAVTADNTQTFDGNTFAGVVVTYNNGGRDYTDTFAVVLGLAPPPPPP